MQTEFSLWLKRRLSELNLQPIGLSKKSGVSISAICRLVSGERSPTVETLQRIAPSLDVSMHDMMMQSGFAPKVDKDINDIQGVPIIGEALAGRITSSNKLGQSTSNILINAKAIVIRGESMEPMAHDGDIIIFNPDSTIRSGDLVYVCLKEDGIFFKRYIDLRFDVYKNYSKGFYSAGKKQSLKLSPVMFYSINYDDYHPIIARHTDIEFMYKVVAIRFK
jgi:transcriptional regulator with XRE-family HTH domain